MVKIREKGYFFENLRVVFRDGCLVLSGILSTPLFFKVFARILQRNNHFPDFCHALCLGIVSTLNSRGFWDKSAQRKCCEVPLTSTPEGQKKFGQKFFDTVRVKNVLSCFLYQVKLTHRTWTCSWWVKTVEWMHNANDAFSNESKICK